MWEFRLGECEKYLGQSTADSSESFTNSSLSFIEFQNTQIFVKNPTQEIRNWTPRVAPAFLHVIEYFSFYSFYHSTSIESLLDWKNTFREKKYHMSICETILSLFFTKSKQKKFQHFSVYQIQLAPIMNWIFSISDLPSNCLQHLFCRLRHYTATKLKLWRKRSEGDENRRMSCRTCQEK